ncbi:CIS tube protein [Gynuella sp.]|uniref:CIS tube protein n=1 Tax=Gynuella sp. TaxID=2969146 RepID=UPI003D12AF69
MNGELEKLLIKAYESEDFSGDAIAEFTAYVNPSEVTIAYEMEYDSAQGSGTTGSRMAFKKVKPGDLSLSFFIDGTGANGTLIDVQEAVETFQTVTGYNGNIHRPNYLKVIWGTLQVKRCVLKSASIAYKMFKPSGEPLRAVISANFTDTSDDETRVALAQDSSPDLTHMRVIKAGDTLPQLCYQIYGDSRYYLKVARANGMDNFRQLKPGTRVYFPPLSKTS